MSDQARRQFQVKLGGDPPSRKSRNSTPRTAPLPTFDSAPSRPSPPQPTSARAAKSQMMRGRADGSERHGGIGVGIDVKVDATLLLTGEMSQEPEEQIPVSLDWGIALMC